MWTYVQFSKWSTMSKVLINLQCGSETHIPEFYSCLVASLGSSSDSFRVPVSFSLNNDVLLLKQSNLVRESDGVTSFLQHSIACPLQVLTESGQFLSDDSGKRDVAVAVSVIIESSDNHVLLTKRPSHMRSSPGAWVPPGGHLDKGETLLECGLREVYEETGLDLKCNTSSVRTLCLWENVFPLALSFGVPRFHSLVIYYHIICCQSHKELTKQIRIDPNEVAAFAWLSPGVISELFKPCDQESYTQEQYVWKDNKIYKKELKYLDMFNRFVWTSNTVYSGVQCSLLEWYKDYSSRQLITKL